jgi:non-ribosomal peptide synthetase component F
VTAAPEIPAQYLLSSHAPEPRTLIDILYDTAQRHPDAPALDDGTVQLTYAELVADIEDSVEWLAARGIGCGDRIGVRMPSGSYALYAAILATLATGAAYVPVDADERAELVLGESEVVGIITERGLVRTQGASRGWRAAPPLGRDDPTEQRRGFPATTTPAARPAFASRSARKARITRWPTASCCRVACAPA